MLTIAAHADGSPAGGAFDLVLGASDFRAETTFDRGRPERSTGSFEIAIDAVRLDSLRRSGEPACFAPAVSSALVERLHALFATALGATIRAEVGGGAAIGRDRYRFVAEVRCAAATVPVSIEVRGRELDGGGLELRGAGDVSIAALRSPALDVAAKAFRVRDRVALAFAIRLSDELSHGHVVPGGDEHGDRPCPASARRR
jgi:hypothetical protein